MNPHTFMNSHDLHELSRIHEPSQLHELSKLLEVSQLREVSQLHEFSKLPELTQLPEPLQPAEPHGTQRTPRRTPRETPIHHPQQPYTLSREKDPNFFSHDYIPIFWPAILFGHGRNFRGIDQIHGTPPPEINVVKNVQKRCTKFPRCQANFATKKSNNIGFGEGGGEGRLLGNFFPYRTDEKVRRGQPLLKVPKFHHLK